MKSEIEKGRGYRELIGGVGDLLPVSSALFCFVSRLLF
jgi:hypothetical protein